jgi:hypothetical protein
LYLSRLDIAVFVSYLLAVLVVGMLAARRGSFAAGACPILVGRLFQTTENWNLILLLFAGVFLLGAICWLFVNPQTGIRIAEREPCAT